MCACVSAEFNYTRKDCQVKWYGPVLTGPQQISVCVRALTCLRCHMRVHFKVKVKSSRIINVAAFYIMLNQTLELLPLEDQLSNLI